MRNGTGKAIPTCPFCGAALKRPEEITIDAGERIPGGACSCGAFYLVDATGKNVGAVMVQALGMAADRLGKKITELVPDEDYEDVVLNYDARTHRSSGATSGYMDGYGRMYLLKVRQEKR